MNPQSAHFANCAVLLDRALIIGGKCELSNGSGKSPGLNQFVFSGSGRLPCSSESTRTFGRLLPILRKPQSQSNASNVSYGSVRRFRGDEKFWESIWELGKVSERVFTKRTMGRRALRSVPGCDFGGLLPPGPNCQRHQRQASRRLPAPCSTTRAIRFPARSSRCSEMARAKSSSKRAATRRAVSAPAFRRVVMASGRLPPALTKSFSRRLKFAPRRNLFTVSTSNPSAPARPCPNAAEIATT